MTNAPQGFRRTQETQRPGVCPILVGRQFELTALRLLLDRLSDGQGQVVLLSGEAGIGKSRLTAETWAVAAARGMRCFSGACFQADRSTPYAPLLDLVRAAATQPTQAAQAEQIRPVLAELSRLFPELSLLAPALTVSRPEALTEAQPSSTEDSEQRRQRIFALLTRFFAEQAAQRPTLVVIEDAHWCDDLSLDYLLRLARRCQSTPLLLLVTYRDDEEAPPGLRRWLADLTRERLAQELTLKRLLRSDVAAMLHVMLEARQSNDTELLDALYARSEGNPFFVEELLKSALNADELSAKPEDWQGAASHADVPRSVQEVVRQRTTTLSADAQRLLTLAAVAGRRFDIALLGELMQCDEERLLALLKEALVAQLVDEESAERFTFRHVLTQQAIYTQLLLRERQTLHRRVAQTLERLVAQGQTQGHTPPTHALEDLARHCYQAGMWEQALLYAQRMGEKALALYAHRAAIEHSTRAIEAARHLDQEPSARVYHLRGQAYEALGDFERARGDYERALDVARAAGESAQEWQSLLALGFLWSGRSYPQAGEWFRAALALADQLDDPLLRARSLNRLGNWLVNTGADAEGREAHREALNIFTARDDTRGMAESLDLLATAYGLAGDRPQSDHYIAQAIALFRALGDTPSLASSLANRALQSTWETNQTIYHTLRTPAENLRDAAEALLLAQQTESLAGQAFAEITLAYASAFAGEMGAALDHAHEALRLARAIEHREWTVFATFALADHYLLLLAPAQAHATLTHEQPLTGDLGSTMWTGALTALRAMIALYQRDLRQAATILAMYTSVGQEPLTFTERQLAWVWGELALAQGEPARALQRADYLIASAPGDPHACLSQPIPHLLRLKGEALLALGRFEEAAQALAEAQRGALARRDTSVLWRIHQSAARLYQRLRDVDRARREADAARQIIEAHAATLPDAALREQFIQAALATLPGRRTQRPRASQGNDLGGLSAREREVAALVAQGYANREIAERLVVSERTAEAHISHILGKLGFVTRAQIAVWAAERGLALPD